MQRFTHLILALLVCLLAACGTLLEKPQPPQLSLAGVTLLEGNLLEQHFLIKLRVQNPNTIDLPINGLRYKLEIDGQEFVMGQTNQAVTVRRLDSELVEVDAYVKLFDLLKQLKALGKNGKAPYRLSGEAFVGSTNWRLPFDRTGEFDLTPLEHIRGLRLD